MMSFGKGEREGKRGGREKNEGFVQVGWSLSLSIFSCLSSIVTGRGNFFFSSPHEQTPLAQCGAFGSASTEVYTQDRSCSFSWGLRFSFLGLAYTAFLTVFFFFSKQLFLHTVDALLWGTKFFRDTKLFQVLIIHHSKLQKWPEGAGGHHKCFLQLFFLFGRFLKCSDKDKLRTPTNVLFFF